jgi:phospholipase C
VNHIIIMMQENHSFDNYYGVLPYVAGGPYHAA